MSHQFSDNSMKYDFYITGTIGEEFDWWTWQRGTTANQVKNFLEQHKNQEVTIAVSSPGGYIDDGLAIMEYIKAHGKCNMVIIGMTASAATILCMKAKSVRIARGSMMLIHNSSQMLDVWTSANKEKIDEIIKAFQHEREQLDTIDKCLADIYSMKNGKTIEENLEMMSKEKWLTAKDALDFGLVDSILDDDDEAALSAKHVKNVYAGFSGAAEHYGLPAFTFNGEQQHRSFMQRMRDAVTKMTNIMNSAEPASDNDSDSEGNANDTTDTNNNNQNFVSMKKIILNLVCGLLAIQDITVNEKGEATLTEGQLNALEKALKEKDDLISSLEKERDDAVAANTAAETAKATAEQEKATAETNLANLQKEFDDFKKEAGDDTHSKPAGEKGNGNAVSSADMYNQVKTLL